MKTIESDERGLIRACAHCGQRNRLIYERLGSVFRCTKCGMEIPPPAEPVEVPGDHSSTHSSLGQRSRCSLTFGRHGVVPVKWSRPNWSRWPPRAQAGLVAKVNTDDLPELGARFSVSAIPTMVLFKLGQETARQSGALPAPAILKFLQPSL